MPGRPGQMGAFKDVPQGMKWCTGCKVAHEISMFGKDRSRFDGLSATCLDHRKNHYEKTYTPKIRTKPPGPSPLAPRENDKQQARHRVNVLMTSGRIPNPNILACTDCGHLGAGRRHEYDHYLGYGSQNHQEVQAVCTICHYAREKERGAVGKPARKIGPEGTGWCIECQKFLETKLFNKEKCHWNGLSHRCREHDRAKWKKYSANKPKGWRDARKK